MELDLYGGRFTWRGSRYDGEERIFEKLDRIFCNMKWRLRFSEVLVKIIPRLFSNHHPLKLVLRESSIFKENRPFRFEVMWLTHDSFTKFLQENWNELGDISSNLNHA